MKKLLKNITLMLAILLLAGCGNNIELKNGEEVLVSFENEELSITAEDLFKKLKENYGANYMIELMDERILDLKYPTDDVAKAFVANQIESMEVSYGGAQKFLEALQSYGYETVDEYEKIVMLGYKRQLAVKDYVKENLSDKDIQKYYDNNMFGDITASHILVELKNSSSMTEEQKREAEDKAQETLKSIYEKLDEGGDFHDVALMYSEDSATADNGGRLGTFSKGEMESEFEKAAMDLEVEKYTKQAIKTSYGYHVILKEDEKEKPALETVRETIIEKLVEEEIANDDKLQYKALIELRKSYGIEINDEDLSSQYENAVNNWLYSKED